MTDYIPITFMPVNLGHWTKVDEVHRGGLPDNWQRYMFQEAAFNWGWLPRDTYGKLCVEVKVRHWKLEGRKAGVALGWQPAVRDGGRGTMYKVDGSEIWMDGKFEKWEMYESDYFPMPSRDNASILLWMLGYGEKLEEEFANSIYTAPGLAMWTVGFFKKVPSRRELELI